MDRKTPRGLPMSKGMALVNALFFFSLALQNPPLVILCHTIWALVLIQAGKRAESRGLRLFYALLGLYAMAVVGVQTFIMLMA